MKILLLNGSPKGEQSNTLKLSTAFIEGLGDNEVKTMHLAKMQISACRGCFCCWNKTPGRCVISDDMKDVIASQLWADVIVWSFPLYYFSVPGLLKNLIDRQLPMSLPFMSDTQGTGSGSHEARYDMRGKLHVLISTCGFYTAEKNYDSVLAMFDHFLGKSNYETIFCGQGELFRVPELRARTDQYLKTVRKAGEEYGSGRITEPTRDALKGLLYPREIFEAMADSSWGIERETGEKTDKSLSFTRQMAALYNKESYDGRNRVLEICYTDLGKTYQIKLNAEGSQVYTDNKLKATTRIETPWDVWTRIARGEIRGDVALAEGKYRVTGDFSLMICWDRFFRGSEAQRKIENKRSRPSMGTMLTAWIFFWIAVSIAPVTGGMAALVYSAVIPAVMFARLTKYDILSCSMVEMLCVLAIITRSSSPALVIGYALFGSLWLGSCLTKEPLCAAYVKYDYNGDDALKNPIFLKTNRIIAIGWGTLYLMIAIWSWFLLKEGFDSVVQIANNLATALMGVFTAWFERWYPAHVAKG